MANRSSASSRQPGVGKSYRCSERGCRISCKRKYDMERHRKAVHHCTPESGDGYIYRCTVPGCMQEKWRLDHFQIHVKRAHPGQIVERIVKQSAVRLTDSEHAGYRESRQQRARHASPGSLAASTDDCSDPLVDDCSERDHCYDDALADSAIGFCGVPNRERQPLHDAPHQHHSELAAKTESLVSQALLDLLRRVQAKQRNDCQWPHQSGPQDITLSADYNDCDVPIDADRDHGDRVHGDFPGLPPSQGQGFGNGGWLGNGEHPFRGHGFGQGQGNNQDPDPDPEPDEILEDQLKRLPCVCCRFQGESLYSHCSNRKQYPSQLWPHHYRHKIFLCWKCFDEFDNRRAVEEHRRSPCPALCVTPACPNYNRFPTVNSPCSHPCHNLSVPVWQMIYRRVHELTLDDWVPDPTLMVQTIDAVLPERHPMFEFSLPVSPAITPAPPRDAPSPPGPRHQNNGFDGGLGGAGGWTLPGQSTVPGYAANVPNLNHISPADMQPVLDSLLLNLWNTLNTSHPVWTPFIEEMYYRAVRPSQAQPRIEQAHGIESLVVVREILAGEYARLINNPIARKPRQWREVASMTRGIIGDQVEIPPHCPWDLEGIMEPETMAAPQAGPSQPRQPLPQTIDPLLETWDQTPLPTGGNDMTIPPGLYLNSASISRTALRSTHASFLAVPQTPYDTHSEPSPGRRPSLGTLTSPSEGLYYSANESFDMMPPQGSFGNSFPQSSPTPLFNNFGGDMDVDEDEQDGNMESMD